MDIKLHWCENQIGTVRYDDIDTRETKKGYVAIDISRWPTVQNQIRCHLWYDSDNRQFKRLPFVQKECQIIKIALIVESPHKDEFTYDFKALQPMNGVSGDSFDNNIERKMAAWFCGNINQSAVYEIKVFNPVQYQASLFHFLNNLIPFMRLSDQLCDGASIPEYVLANHMDLKKKYG